MPLSLHLLDYCAQNAGGQRVWGLEPILDMYFHVELCFFVSNIGRIILSYYVQLLFYIDSELLHPPCVIETDLTYICHLCHL